ncbi:MAG: rhomboid family intramembrane serine protease [Chlamydiales bacterium]|nr:rhomboid family intramembrane serine protease [Chlamydiia bacterium]MCP5508461.1 rhomboid family intramembrane serine protease [Chlamydiales bacterium]
MGTFVLDLIGEKSFLKLYFGSGIFAALITLLSMPLFGQYTALSGPAAAVLAVLTVWTMFNPESQLMLFFILPIKAKWLVITAIGIIALINFTNLNFISIIYYLSGATFGYCYSVIAWGLQSPFPITHRFDETLTRFSHPWAHNSSGKIIDLAKARKMQKNEEFMDEMLEKISKHGKDSLSWWEKRKMRKISETKNGK